MRVAVHKSIEPTYPEAAPFHPSEVYPEAPFREIDKQENLVYAGVRELLRLYGLDSEKYGTPSWNPFHELVRPGDLVLLKPNLIKEKHPRDPEGWVYMMTHGSVIRAVADYVIRALNGRGTIIVADAPQTDSSFAEIARLLQLTDLTQFYRSKGVDFQLVDIRKYEWRSRDDVVVSRTELSGDPYGYVLFDLGRDSLFYRRPGEGRYYGADYDTKEINRHHHGETHRYLLSGVAVKCDVFINLPKMKTHKKTGVTLSLKNLVGINGDKNYLPHHTDGTPSSGGDQFPDATFTRGAETMGLHMFRRIALSAPGVGPWVYRSAKRVGEKFFGKTSQVIRSGNWSGNDTTWRMCLDLNRALLYGNSDGTLRRNYAERKKYFTLIDGIIAGDGNGPIDVDPVCAGTLLCGVDPVATDTVAATLMGFDCAKLPILQGAYAMDSLPITEVSPADIFLVSNNSHWNCALREIDSETFMNFRPHFGWRGAIENKRAGAAATL